MLNVEDFLNGKSSNGSSSENNNNIPKREMNNISNVGADTYSNNNLENKYEKFSRLNKNLSKQFLIIEKKTSNLVKTISDEYSSKFKNNFEKEIKNISTQFN